MDLLKAAGHRVVGCDLGLFDGCEFSSVVRPDVEIAKDVRDLDIRDLAGADAVMHLAAISNDPMGALDPKLTESVNREGSIHLAETAKKAGVPRFLFSSSCSIYGKGTKSDLCEDDELAPVSVYAASKIAAERAIGRLADRHFCPVFLRNSTAFGGSPMLRIDLVANNFLACALAHGEIRIMSDGTPWRPLIHCRDIARAFMAFCEAPADLVRGASVNVGGNRENYQVRDVADAVLRLVPGARVHYTGETGPDPRNYRVNFDRLGKLLPGFKLEFDLESGLRDLAQSLKAAKFSAADFSGPKYVRLKTLQQRLHLIKAR